MSREVPVTGSYKVGLSKGRPRIWIDGKKLAEAGFVGGSTYYYEVWAGMIVCSLDKKRVPSGPDRGRKVTGRPDGKPIIDIVGSDVEAAFPGVSRVVATFTKGMIVIAREA
jgi:hypothetical protein